MSLFLRAYSLGGGTYTGIEAVSNNVQTLREPVVRTGKLTMFYMAASLAFTAGGIILLYLLWKAQPVDGQTLNAVVFGTIIDSFGLSAPIQPDRVAGGAGHRSRPALRRGQHRLPRRPAGAVEHGGRFLAAAPVPPPVDAPGHAERHRDHGAGGAGDPAVERRQGRPAGRAVFDQRVPDVLAVAAGTVHLLVARARQGRPLGAPSGVLGARLGGDVEHPRGHRRREIRRRWLGDGR